MALMQSAIKELRITSENQPLKKILIEWFLEQDPKLSTRSVEAMATLIRLPEKKKGGYHTPRGGGDPKFQVMTLFQRGVTPFSVIQVTPFQRRSDSKTVTISLKGATRL